MVFSFLVTLLLETSSAKMTSGSLVSRTSFGELIYGRMAADAFLMMSVEHVFTVRLVIYATDPRATFS